MSCVQLQGEASICIPNCLRTNTILYDRTNCFEPFLLTESGDFWDLVEVNLRGPVDLTRIVLPGMIERNRGCFIYVSSIAAAFSWPYVSILLLLFLHANVHAIPDNAL